MLSRTASNTIFSFLWESVAKKDYSVRKGLEQLKHLNAKSAIDNKVTTKNTRNDVKYYHY